MPTWRPEATDLLQGFLSVYAKLTNLVSFLILWIIPGPPGSEIGKRITVLLKILKKVLALLLRQLLALQQVFSTRIAHLLYQVGWGFFHEGLPELPTHLLELYVDSFVSRIGRLTPRALLTSHWLRVTNDRSAARMPPLRSLFKKCVFTFLEMYLTLTCLP